VRGQVSTDPGDRLPRHRARDPSPRVTGGNFPLEDLDATLTRERRLAARAHRPRALCRRDGDGRAAHRQPRQDRGRRVQPMTLSVDANDVSVERFFGDLGLPGTGLSGGAAIALNLRWAEGGIKRANGAASIAIAPGPRRRSSAAASASRSRAGAPCRSWTAASDSAGRPSVSR
jgi:hypothetical protein